MHQGAKMMVTNRHGFFQTTGARLAGLSHWHAFTLKAMAVTLPFTLAMFLMSTCATPQTVTDTTGIAAATNDTDVEDTTSDASPVVATKEPLSAMAITASDAGRVRTIITTDGEIDDRCSMIRYLLYANEFKLEGIVASASMFHYSEKEGEIFKDRIYNQAIIDTYAEVYKNLCMHADGYPTPEYLTSINVNGNISRPGEMDTDTEGSKLIKSCILDDQEGSLFLQVWGGTNTIAAALRSIEEEYKNTDEWEEIYTKVCNKISIFLDLDQDNTLNDYILPHWPGVKVIASYSQFGAFAYGWNDCAPEEYTRTFTHTWMAENVYGKGTLADLYQRLTTSEEAASYYTTGLFTGWTSGSFLSEGDSINYLYILDVGLRQTEDPSYGGWGGRFAAVKREVFANATSMLSNLYHDTRDDGNIHKPLYRWFEAIQNDFAARMSWCTESTKDTNHAPVVSVAEGIDFSGAPGTNITFTASAADPDGDNVSISFWQYDDADTYAGSVKITDSGSGKITFAIPEDAKAGSEIIPGDTIHIIVEAKDDGINPITRYQRVIVEVTEEERAE
jgi:hypothetical protein